MGATANVAQATRLGLCAVLAIVGLAPRSSAEPFVCDRDFAIRHGITCRLSFEDTGIPEFSSPGAPPTYLDSLHFVDGPVDRAILLRTSRERELGKVEGRASGLNFDAAGLLYGEQGAMAFWFQPQWDGDDSTIRSGSNSTGPSLISVASIEPTYYEQFIRMQIKGGSFYIWVVDVDRKWHGPNYGTQLRTWRKGEWRHLAFTWHCEQGVRFFDNGELVYDTWGTERWKPATPKSIGVGSGAPTGRPQVVRGADMAMDDLFLFDRPIDSADVRALMTGRYDALAMADAPTISEAERQSRTQQFGLGVSTQRPTAGLTPAGWTMQLAVQEIQTIATDYMEGRFLCDGLTTRQFHLAQGGLTFDRDVVLSLVEGSQANYAIVSGHPAPGSTLVTASGGMPLAVEADGLQRIHLSPAAGNIKLALKGNSALGECQLLRVTKHAPTSGQARPLAVENDPSVLGSAGTALWRNLCAGDRRVLLSAEGDRANRRAHFPACGKLHLFTQSAETNIGVEAIRLRLRVRNPQKDVVLGIKVHDPFEPERFRLLVDVGLPKPVTDDPLLSLDLHIPGLVQGKGQRLWIELVSDTAIELFLGPEGSGLDIVPCPIDRVADAFARSYLRFLNDEFQSRMAHNFKYASRGVQPVNPLTIGLDNILRIAPGNAHAQAMHRWARLSRWPAWDDEPPGPADAPRWAQLQRAVITEALDTIHWWIDHRQDATGYVIGNANMWNDLTKLFNEFAVFALVTGDMKLIAAMERYLDAHYASGRMEKGYSKPLTDTVHSQEEASYLLPTLTFLRYGEPRHVERLMENAANIPYWTGLTAPKQRHFKSTYYTATKMKTEGKFGRDIPMNAATLMPATFLAWYNGTPAVTQWLTEYANAWCAAAARQTETKPGGLPPTFVDFKTGELGPNRHAYFQTLGFQLLAAWQLTGRARYLAPLEALLANSDTRGVYALGLNAPEWRRETKDTAHDEAILAQANTARTAILEDAFFQRGVGSADVHMILGHLLTGDSGYLELALHNAWRNNARARRIYTETDPDTDRVYPWGRIILPWMMCGGNGLNARASAPLPTIAVSWGNTGNNLAAWVKAQSTSSLGVSLYNFGPSREVLMHLWQLEPGTYQLTCAAEKGAPDSRVVQRVAIRRGTTIALPLPSQRLVTLSVQQLTRSELPRLRSDAAISAAEIAAGTVAQGDGSWRCSVPVHNLGAVPVPPATLTVTDAASRVVARADVPTIPAPVDLIPKMTTINFDIPELFSFPLHIRVTSRTEEITSGNNTCTLSAPVKAQP